MYSTNYKELKIFFSGRYKHYTKLKWEKFKNSVKKNNNSKVYMETELHVQINVQFILLANYRCDTRNTCSLFQYYETNTRNK